MIDPKSLFQPHMPLETRSGFSRLCHWKRLGLHKLVKYYYYPSYWDPCGQITLYVNAKAWESLPKEYQAILDAACAEAHVDMQAKYDARNLAALKRLVGGGVQLCAFPHAVAEAAWKTAN